MSSRELIESLRAASRVKIRLIQQEAEREARVLEAAKEERLEGLRRRYADKLASAEGDESLRALAEADNRARLLRLDAEKSLSDRLLSIARSSLAMLRDDNYPAVFEKLARELPSFSWKTVRVNPADAGLARSYFAEAEIVAVENISGGVDATLAGGTLRIINTFEKRLERAWSEMLPLLVKDVYREVSDGAPVQPS